MTENQDLGLAGEDPLEQLLDQETDEDFGLPEFKSHFADSTTPAKLKEWSAQDFSSIYVRFRPHLERHARRFLVNPSQVEEVVQDAFLYLMTTLPELDSEVGVLRFLKWKTRLLALDVIRANSRASFAPIEDQPEFEAKLPEISSSLEQADDAAIVSLALAKLQPRQREALIATLYEEKSSDLVAAQMGLSENAFRQLLFRARSSFKKALIGEAEVQGKSISQILSIAARKASAESGKLVSVASAFLLVLAVSIGIIPNLSSDTVQVIAEPTRTQQSLPQTDAPGSDTEASAVAEAPAPVLEVVASEEQTTVAVAAQVAPPAPTPIKPEVTLATTFGSSDSLRKSLASALGSKAISQLGSSLGTKVNSATLGDTRLIEISNFSGLSVTLEYDLASEQIVTFARAGMKIGEDSFIAVPTSQGASLNSEAGLTTLYFAASDFLIADATGQLSNLVWEDVPLSSARVRVAITFDENQNVIGSQLTISREEGNA